LTNISRKSDASDITQLADDWNGFSSNGSSSPKVETLTLFRPSGADLPRDKEKGTLLLELFDPTVSLSEMVVNDPGEIFAGTDRRRNSADETS